MVPTEPSHPRARPQRGTPAPADCGHGYFDSSAGHNSWFTPRLSTADDLIAKWSDSFIDLRRIADALERIADRMGYK
jgi:hypothetical protein